MDVNAIVSSVSTLGFPIVCCGALFWYVNKTQKEFTQKMGDTVNRLNDSINEMNSSIIKLITTVSILNKIGGEEK